MCSVVGGVKAQEAVALPQSGQVGSWTPGCCGSETLGHLLSGLPALLLCTGRLPEWSHVHPKSPQTGTTLLLSHAAILPSRMLTTVGCRYDTTCVSRPAPIAHAPQEAPLDTFCLVVLKVDEVSGCW